MLIAEATKSKNAEAIRLQDLATHVGLTPRYFHKIFKDKMGVTPKEYARLNKKESTNTVAVAEDATFVLNSRDSVDVNDDFLVQLPIPEFDPSLTDYETSVDTPASVMPPPLIRYLGEGLGLSSWDGSADVMGDSRCELDLEYHYNEDTRLTLEHGYNTQIGDQAWPVAIQFEPIPSLSEFSLDFSSTTLLADDPFAEL